MSASIVVPSDSRTWTLSALSMQLVDPGAGAQRDAVAAGHPPDDPAEQLAQRALIRDVERLDDGDGDPAVVRGRRDLGADEAGADDEQAPARVERAPQVEHVVEGAQQVDARVAGQGRQLAGAYAGGDDQRVVAHLACRAVAVRGEHDARPQPDGAHAAAQIELERRFVAALAGQVRSGWLRRRP